MQNLKLVLVGSGGVGKSCLTIQFIAQRFVDEYDPTLEDSYRKQTTVDGEEVILDIYDTAGQEDFSAVRDQYMRTGDGFLCVYSITYAQSFQDVSKLHSHILRVKDVDYVPFVMVGNKCDLTEFREVPKSEGELLAKKLACTFMETSAKERINVEQSFHELVKLIKKHKGAGGVSPSQGKDTDDEETKKKKNCVLC